MAGTLGSIYDNVSFSLEMHTEALARLQEQASSGARVLRPSDAPTDAYRILELGSQEGQLLAYLDNITEVISTLEISSTIIEEISSNIFAAEVRLTQVLSGTYADENRRVAAREINDILEQLVILANSQRMGQYLFGGAKTSSAPYVVERTNGKITGVTYQGSLEGRQVEVAPGVEASGYLVGDTLFRSNNRSSPVFSTSGGTGAQAGTGTSTVRGDVWLEVRDNGGYEMSIDGGASWVAVDGTANQAVTDSVTGRVLYVDTTGINSTGKDLVRVPGTYDIFGLLITMRDVLESGDSEQLQQVEREVANAFDELKQLVTQGLVSVGIKISSLSQIKGSLDNLKFDVEEETGRLQSADLAQVAMDIAQRQVLYEMSLSIAAKLLSISLLDFIA